MYHSAARRPYTSVKIVTPPLSLARIAVRLLSKEIGLFVRGPTLELMSALVSCTVSILMETGSIYTKNRMAHGAYVVIQVYWSLSVLDAFIVTRSTKGEKSVGPLGFEPRTVRL